MKKAINLSEKSLATNIHALSREIIHDFFVVCRKAGIYSVQHPMVEKAVSRPFMTLQKVFQFKKYFTLYLAEGDLFVNNIILKDMGVSDYLKEKMYELEITSILFDETMTASDLEIFIDRFVKRVPTTSSDYFIDKFLANRNVTSIQVNSDLGKKLFNASLRYRSELGEDYSVRRLVANYFSGNNQLAINLLSSAFGSTADQAEAAGVDYHLELVGHILPEKFAQLAPSELLEMADQILTSESGLDENAMSNLERLVKACDYHPKRDDILDKIRGKFGKLGIDEAIFAKSLSQIGSLKLDAANAADNLYIRIFSDEFDPGMYAEFHDAFFRLIRTRQMGKAASLAEVIIEKLASDSPHFRQHAIYLLEDIIESCLSTGECDFFDVIIRHMQALFTQGRETFEFSQVVSALLKTMLAMRRYEPVAAFLGILSASRKIEADTTIYDSVTIKRIFDDLDNGELIKRLACELEQPGNNQIKWIREVLVAIQSEQVAFALAAVVTHPERSVRQHCLRVLAELGWPAVKVFSDILSDESNFLRPENRHELPDVQWFLVRNAIFVLGNLGDPKACNAMRLRLADPDVRVRRELVRALDKIDDEEAVDLMMILADDIDASVREAAIIALGLDRRHDFLPFFIDLLSRNKGEMARIITAIAHIGADDSSNFLSELYQDNERLKSLASDKASVKDIKGIIAKALERIDGLKDSAKAIKPETKRENKSESAQKSGLGKTAKSIPEQVSTQEITANAAQMARVAPLWRYMSAIMAPSVKANFHKYM